MLAPEMQEQMYRLIQIEKLADELESLGVENLQFNERKEKNRECLGAFRRAEIQTDTSKLWYAMGGNASLMLKLPRKNAVQVIEGEQAKLIGLIDKTRAQIKAKTRELLVLQPSLTDMDPYTVQLLLKERKIEEKRLEGGSSDSDE